MNSYCLLIFSFSAAITCSEGFLPWGFGGGGGGFGVNDLYNFAGQGGGFPLESLGFNFRPQGHGGSNKNFDSSVKQDRSEGGDFASAALQETNKYRKMHQAGPLSLDPELSAGCQAWAERMASTGQFKHSCSMCSEYGENLWMMGGLILSPPDAARKAVTSWYNEVKDYNFNNPGFSGATGHFTALVWKGSTKMGIGLATNPAKKTTYVVARYVEAGNMQGAFAENVLPAQ